MKHTILVGHMLFEKNLKPFFPAARCGQLPGLKADEPLGDSRRNGEFLRINPGASLVDEPQAEPCSGRPSRWRERAMIVVSKPDDY